ncbi:MAG: tRNA epoxyqueuosine(34) reductase QueG [Melioribacteraceae bacterium]|nr:tRNA epoxyqueuosine(34) reductase QueG [Melioribacteraceae bacterium]
MLKIENEIVISLVKKLGFNLVGFSNYDLLENETEILDKWLHKGYNAGMEYMERNIEKRKDVRKILPSAKSVISVGLNYYKAEQFENQPGSGKVSKYAWGTDYHYIIWDKLEILETELKIINPQVECKSYVDTGPVMDKAWASRSGLGWIGKNSNVINKQIGSWFFIANIITNIEFDNSEPVTDHCGSCKACIDACPTNAIKEGRVIDANKCISYLTIENKGEISSEFSSSFDNWLFGCDVCQDVCPWNKKLETETDINEFKDSSNKELNFEEILELTNSTFKNKYKNSPIFRAKAKGLKRNARFLSDKK